MALDPRISLAVQPAEITAQPMSPYQLIGGALSLQNLMTQGQMGQLQLEQAQQFWQQQQAVNQELARQFSAHQPAVTMAPAIAPPVAPSAATPTLGTLFAPTTPAITPTTTAPLAPPPQPAAVTGYPMTMTGGLGLPGGTLQPLLPDFT